MIPIFIIVHDRVECLKRAVASFESQIATPIKIIFHNVASTYKPCLDYLEEMYNKGYTVYHSRINNHHSVLDSIKDYLQKNRDCQYYCVTDPDIELDNVSNDILDVYIELLKKHGTDCVVGPMLRIDDIPDTYPKKGMVLQLHKGKGAWGAPIKSGEIKSKTVNWVNYPIDTTFQLAHRSNLVKFPRKGIRCLSPYSARHLDWYINPKELTPDQEYYSAHASNTSNWSTHLESSNIVKTPINITKPKVKSIKF